MNLISYDERTRLFKEAISESDLCFNHKDYENAFRSLAKANLYLPDFTDQFNYLFDLKEIKDRSASICEKDKNPNYEAYLIFTLESHALEIARDLVAFPHLAPFYYRKKNQFSYDPNNLWDFMETALKKLKIYDYRKNMFDEYTKFIYDELPIIYGIPPKYNEDAVNRIFENMSKNREEWNELIHRFSVELNQKSIDYIPYDIYNFVSKLIKKYYDMGNLCRSG